MTNEEYMSLALDLAREAAEHGEVPVGCVIADAEGRIIGRGRNRREELGDATAHAEVEAIREAGAALGSWRLEGSISAPSFFLFKSNPLRWASI